MSIVYGVRPNVCGVRPNVCGVRPNGLKMVIYNHCAAYANALPLQRYLKAMVIHIKSLWE